jgi:hypothetical protein
MDATWRWAAVVCLAGAAGGSCRAPAARSQHSFDQIQHLVAGRTEDEVERILGSPDTRESRLADDDVWIWWNFTFLDGEQYAPELRCQIVHLEITFDRPSGVSCRQVPRAAWRAGPFSVNFSRRLPSD